MPQSENADTSALPLEERDALTGLPNRVAIQNLLGKDRAPADGPLALLAVEISRFGSISDSIGIALADQILRMVARRLRKTFSHASLIGRNHGDHFCLAFEGEVDIERQITLALDFMQRPIATRGEVIVLAVRVGIARLGAEVPDANELLHAAELALHRAKQADVKFCHYSRELEEQARQAHMLENDLRVALATRHADLHRAISNEEFQLVYQPVVNLRDRSIHSFEALVRWHHPQRGLIPPGLFIPVAERIQVMNVLGNWILRKACRDATGWPDNADGSAAGVCVNVSPTQFTEPDLLLASVRQAISESGIDPSRIKLEITESTAFTPITPDLLTKLREMGIQVALDDFGTGYSSLTQLNALPLQYIKLDRSFIRDIAADSPAAMRSERMSRAVLSLARAFDLTPIIEGIETGAQLEKVRALGANLVQGYLFSPPVHDSEVPALFHSIEEACGNA
jgi:diguanylate cyclase (GGDEF)-like protein